MNMENILIIEKDKNLSKAICYILNKKTLIRYIHII